MVYIPRKPTIYDDVRAFVESELHVDVKKEFSFLNNGDFVTAKQNIEAGMLRGSVYSSLKDMNEIRQGRLGTELDFEIKAARQKLTEIVTSFNGSEGHKTIRMACRRKLRGLLNKRALAIRAELRTTNTN